VTLDRDTLAKTGDRLIINLASGKAEGRTVQSVAGRAITVTTAYSETPTPQLQWALDADDLAIPLYRVLSTKRTTEGDYEIAALQFEPSKFAYIDTGAKLEERPISVIPITVVPAPASVTLTSTSAIAQGLAVTTMTITWPAVNGAVGYDVEWRKDNGNWIKVQRTGSTSVDITGIYSGGYLARVRAVSAYDISSIWRSSILTQLKGKVGLPPAVTSLTATSLIFGIGLKWTFPPGAEDTQRTEIWYAPTNNFAGKTKLTDLAYPQSEYALQSLLAGTTFFFWARLVDRTGNIGPFYPVLNGVMGQSSSEAGPILQLIAGKISETELGQHLLSRIDLIDGNGPGSVNQRIGELQDEIGNIVDALVYVPTDAYVRDNTVRVGDNLWTAIANVPAAANGSNGPPNPTYWVNSGQSIRTANALAAQVTKNTADITTIDGKTSATASQLQALQASSRDDNGQGELADALKGWDSTASYAQEVKVRAEQDFAQTQRTTLLDARVGNSESRIATVETTMATNEQATAQQLATLGASIGTNQAAIQTEATVRSNADGALSTRIEDAQATANNATAAVQTVSQAQAATDGKLSTMWSVKMQINANGQYVAAGIGLGIENTGAGLQSQFLVAADRFAVVNTIAGGAISVPFAVQGGQVFINQAFIQDGTITNAKIGSYISSTNYIAGQMGWILNKDGTFEINSALGGGGRQVINSYGGKVFDANGVKRYQWGNLDA
jgi:predicted phage tail protein